MGGRFTSKSCFLVVSWEGQAKDGPLRIGHGAEVNCALRSPGWIQHCPERGSAANFGPVSSGSRGLRLEDGQWREPLMVRCGPSCHMGPAFRSLV